MMTITNDTATAVICTKIPNSKAQCSVPSLVANNHSNGAVPQKKASEVSPRPYLSYVLYYNRVLTHNQGCIWAE